MVEVQGGVKPGDKIVVNPSGRLKDGAKIKTLER
jgi:multidrug efflux pump subunit AcrA (membrane-fusion protein)